MYVTTSRKPSQVTRRLARAFAAFLGFYAPRGKSSVEEVVDEAKELGHSRVAVVHERNGQPSAISFIAIGKGWKWLKEVDISVKDVPKLGPIEKDAVLEGPTAKDFGELFDLVHPRSMDVIRITADSKGLVFKSGKHELRIFITGMKEIEK